MAPSKRSFIGNVALYFHSGPRKANNFDRILVGDAVKNHVAATEETPVTVLDFVSLCAYLRSIGKPLEAVINLSCIFVRLLHAARLVSVKPYFFQIGFGQLAEFILPHWERVFCAF